MTPKQKARLVAVLDKHFGKRRDFYHIVTGPKRETWFTAESIAALSRAESGSLSRGFIIFGEKSYSNMLRELKLKASSSKGLSKIPDIVGYSFRNNAVAFVLEAKLIDELDDDEAKTILADLKKQLDRAKTILPSATAIGIVFGVHHLSRAVSKRKNANGTPKHTAVNPQRYFDWLKDHIETVFPAPSCKWLDGRKVVPVARLQSVKPLGGKWNGQVSLGLAVFEI